LRLYKRLNLSRIKIKNQSLGENPQLKEFQIALLKKSASVTNRLSLKSHLHQSLRQSIRLKKIRVKIILFSNRSTNNNNFLAKFKERQNFPNLPPSGLIS
jgi:hypothetical protein